MARHRPSGAGPSARRAPEGVKGISLFIVREIPGQRRRLAERATNDLVCASIEHKLGIHASPPQ